ncbi:MAG: hypothetical protein IJ712_06765 [Anaerovibrio sp.]|nr:hypothetical protein [Anaerovibrio sp.]
MKKSIICVALLLASMVTSAQEVRVAEPEFVNSYNILTSDSTSAVLPKENGTLGKHQNKVKKWSKIIGGASQIAGAAGIFGMATAGSASGVISGARVVGSAASVGSAADAVNGLAGSAGMDIIFKGGHSTYQVQPDGKNVRLLIKAESNETDPMDCYRIVRFNTSKKERRIQWLEIEPALIGSEDAQKAGYIQFEGHKYGEQSYLLTIPASELKEGEYGIVFMSIATAMAVPVGTFGVK